MVYCLGCNSINVKISDGNFASVKPEGQPAVKQEHDKNFFYCWDCGSDWESIHGAKDEYFEYLRLRDRTSIVARDLHRGGSYEPAPLINGMELLRRGELARKIFASYRHVLDISYSEWFLIKKDAF